MPGPQDIQAQRKAFFDSKRADVERSARGAVQEQDDAINRRFTSLGQGASGAAIATQVKAREGLEAQKRQAFNDLAGQELQAGEADLNRQFQSEEAQKGRDFQSGEARIGREFAASQAGLDRGFQSGEAEKQRLFASGESRLGREFAGSQAERDMAFKRGMFDVEQGNKLKELDLAERQFLLDKDTTEFNKRLAEAEANREDAGLLGGGGLLGTGLGGEKGILGTGIGKKGASTEQRVVDAVLTGGITEAANLVSGGGCFLTTAAVDVIGLPDDCWVLNAARKFRDTYMTQNLERATQIKEYYEYAPQIVEQINSKEDANRVWKSLFWRDIIPFVTEVEKGAMDKAHELYLSMINKAKDIAGMEA